jgi:hypothetical protein
MLAALWLQAVILPLQTARAEAELVGFGELSFGFCSTPSTDHDQKPAHPSKLPHQHDCCLTGSCSLAHVYLEPASLQWQVPKTAAIQSGRRLSDAAPRAPPRGVRPYTTGPPTRL